MRTLMQDQSSCSEYGGVSEICVPGERSCGGARHPKPQFAQGLAQLLGFARGEPKNTLPEKRGIALKDGESGLGDRIKRPERKGFAISGDLSPEPVRPGLNVLLKGTGFENGVRPCQDLAPASGERGWGRKAVMFEQFFKEGLCSFAPEWSAGVLGLEHLEFLEGQFKGPRSECTREAQDAIEQNEDFLRIYGVSSQFRADLLGAETMETSRRDLEGPRGFVHPGHGERARDVGLTGESGSRLIDSNTSDHGSSVITHPDSNPTSNRGERS
jgi:hypothetical protein